MRLGGRIGACVLVTMSLTGCAESGHSEEARSTFGAARCGPMPAGMTDGAAPTSDPWLQLSAADDRGEIPLYRVTDAVLAHGAIYVINAATELLKYSYDGRLLMRVGGEGEGPGEFLRASTVREYRRDSVIVFDRALQRLTVFSKELEFGRVVRPDPLPNAEFVGTLADGSTVIRGDDLYFDLSPKRDSTYAVVYDADGRFVARSPKLPHTVSFRLRWGDGLRAGMMPFGPRGWIVAGGREVIFGNVDKPVLQLWSVDVHEATEVRFGCQAAPTPDRVIDEYVERQLSASVPGARSATRHYYASVPFPDSLPLFEDLVRSDDGRIWLGAYDDPSRPSGSTRKWVGIDADGAVREVVRLPSSMRITQIGDGFVLGIVWDELGGEAVVAYDRGG